jgi:2-polyprenyl-3-methyl-5-hydroxy-6-metoxy-1,4-benzoquinol methylase
MTERVCPPWIGYLLACPVRELFQNPGTILKPYVRTGMTALDVGCAMGFFSLPLARLVGPTGKVVCVDLQEKMIRRLERRARKAGLADRIQTRVCSTDGLGLDDLVEKVDFALVFAVVHEVPNVSELFSQLHKALKPTGMLLLAEPTGHVSPKDFDTSTSIATQAGFALTDRPRIRRSLTVLLSRC